MDGIPIKIEPVECIPSEHLQLEFNGCHRCAQQDAQIQALQKENADLKQMNEKLKAELAKFQSKPDEFEHFIAMPLSPIETGISITPQLEKCFVCLAEYMTNDEQKHICNGEQEICCEYCEHVFTSTMDLIEHSNAYHNEKSFYCCTKCPEMFSMAQLLQFHEMSHPITEPSIYFCTICSEHFLSKDELDEHHDRNHKRPRKTKESKKQPASKPPQSLLSLKSAMKELGIDEPIVKLRAKPGRKTKIKPFKCAHCNECFTTSKKIQVHMKRVHDKAKTFECYICKEKCKSLHKTEIHLREHLREEKCAVCQEMYTKLELEAHICCGLKSMNCGYCQQTFMTTKSLLQHLQVCKNEKVSYECGIGKCSKFFLMKFLADLHRENHKAIEPPKKYACSTCGNSFNCIRQLKLHKERHNENQNYLCDECGKSFLCKKNLQSHQRIHNKKPIKCAHCDTTCLGQSAYRRHLLKHQNYNIKFVCNICGLQLSNTQKLAIHKKIHTRTEADRVHGCMQCEKKFFTKKSARAHYVKAHKMNRFECDLCDQSYKYKGDLNKHKRAVHSVGYLYACTHCEKRFAQSYELDRHLFEHFKLPAEEQPLPV